MSTHLGMNTQVLPGAQSQPQKWQLLALLFLIEAEQLSKFFNHLLQMTRERGTGLNEKSKPLSRQVLAPSPASHRLKADGNHQGDRWVRGE